MNVMAREDGDHCVISGHTLWPGQSGRPENFQSQWLNDPLGHRVCAISDRAGGDDNGGIFYVPAEAGGLDFSQPHQQTGFSDTGSNVDLCLLDVRIPKRYHLDTRRGQGSTPIKQEMIGLVWPARRA